jgi:ankyrin repeat protein
LWKNNISHIKETYHQIDETNVSMIQDMLIISAMKSVIDPETSTFLFLNKRWIIDPRYVNARYSNCLIMGCRENPCLEMIKLLLESFRENVNCVDEVGDNCFLAACEGNANIDVIKYLTQLGTVNIMHRNARRRDCFLKACIGNNIETVRYLVNDLGIDTKICDICGDNCLNLACLEQGNVEMIKFLINDLNVSIEHVDYERNNCLIAACMGGNLDAIKFLINDVKMSVDYENGRGNCLAVTFCCDDIEKRSETIEYLINETDIMITVINMKLETFQSIVSRSRIRDLGKLNILIQKALIVGFGLPKHGVQKALMCLENSTRILKNWYWIFMRHPW